MGLLRSWSIATKVGRRNLAILNYLKALDKLLDLLILFFDSLLNFLYHIGYLYDLMFDQVLMPRVIKIFVLQRIFFELSNFEIF